jgi:multiple antibiotic resistance protein
MNFSTIFISVFLLINPFGAIPIFLAILANFTNKQKITIMIRESFFAFVITSLFFFFGKGILQAMNISVAAVETAGGVILFLMAIKMIYPSKEKNGSDDDGDPFIVPLAMPLMAGPAIIAMVMIISQNSIISVWQSWLAIFLALFVSMLILLCGTFLQKIFGSKGMRAIERLMGMILTIIATQMIFSGTGLARLLELSH